MRKYKTKAAFISFSDDGEECITADTVFEDDPQDTFTGLYDATGQEIHRHLEKEPFGFVNINSQ